MWERRRGRERAAGSVTGERSATSRPPAKRPTATCVACRGSACCPLVGSSALTFAGAGITADSSSEAGGEDPHLCSLGWLTEFVSCGCSTDILFSCWSSAEHHSHFLEASTFLKMCPLLHLQCNQGWGGLSPTCFTSPLLLLLSRISNPGGSSTSKEFCG